MCLKTINQLSPEAWHFKCMHFFCDVDRRLACRPQLPAGWDILKHRVTRLLALLNSEHSFISRTVSLPRCVNHTKRCYIFLMHRSWSTPAPKQTNQKKREKADRTALHSQVKIFTGHKDNTMSSYSFSCACTAKHRKSRLYHPNHLSQNLAYSANKIQATANYQSRQTSHTVVGIFPKLVVHYTAVPSRDTWHRRLWLATQEHLCRTVALCC